MKKVEETNKYRKKKGERGRAMWIKIYGGTSSKKLLSYFSLFAPLDLIICYYSQMMSVCDNTEVVI